MTTLIGGLGLALVGVLELLPIVLNWFPAAYDTQNALRSGPAQSLQIIALLVSCVILAFGLRREGGIVGASAVGRMLLVLWGLANPIAVFVSFALVAGGLAGTLPGVVTGTVFQLLPLLALAGAAIMVARAHVLDGFARWILVGVAATEVLLFSLSALQNAPQAYYAIVFSYGAAIPPLMLAAAGVSVTLYGRSAAITQRLRAIYAQW
jgi:hypothetical protein